MLLMLVALYWGINFLRGKDIFKQSETYFAAYDSVNGMLKSASVVIKGVKVGVVRDIVYDPAHSDKVVLELNVDSRLRIPENSQARIFSASLMEGKAIEIVPGNSPRYLNNRDTIHSFSDPGLLEMAGSELEQLTAKVSQVADNVSKLLAGIDALVEENRANINAMVGHMAGITESLDLTLSGERDNLRHIIANIEGFSATLARNSGNVDSVMTNLGAFSSTLSEIDLARLDGSLARLDGILAGVQAGEGTLGKLVADDSLYNALTKAGVDLTLLLEDLKAHPGRYVSVSVFGRKEK
jgi:phospholipid/cholesterol/gamma-HCH transport system substrate-binding protein